MYAESDAGIVKVLLQLLDGQTQNWFDLFAGEVSNAFPGLDHVLDEAGADDAQFHRLEVVFALEARVPQDLPQKLMVTFGRRLIPLVVQLDERTRLLAGFLGAVIAKKQIPKRRSVLVLERCGRTERRGRRGGRSDGVSWRYTAVIFEENFFEQRIGLVLFRKKVRVQTVVDVLLGGRWGTGHCAVRRIFLVA